MLKIPTAGEVARGIWQKPLNFPLNLTTANALIRVERL
jgi:hypothetical protein